MNKWWKVRKKKYINFENCRSIGSVCKEYFKESFDVIFEYLVGDGIGEGKVTKDVSF